MESHGRICKLIVALHCGHDDLMNGNEPKANIDDAEVSTAIQYLDPDLNEPIEENEGLFVIGSAVMILLLGCLGFLWFCHRLS